MGQRGLGVARLPLNDGQLAVQERAFGRARDRGGVRSNGLVGLPGPCRLSRGGETSFGVPEPQHLDAPAEIDERRVHGERRLECRDRLRFPIQREQRLPFSDECRRCNRVGARARGRNTPAPLSRPTAQGRRNRRPLRPDRTSAWF